MDRRRADHVGRDGYHGRHARCASERGDAYTRHVKKGGCRALAEGISGSQDPKGPQYVSIDLRVLVFVSPPLVQWVLRVKFTG